MPIYYMGRAAQLLGVSPDTVRRWADGGMLATHRDGNGYRVVKGSDLATFAVELAAREGAPDAPQHSSARNRFPGIVTRVTRGDIMAQVEIQAGPHRVVSLLSCEAVDSLALDVGMEAVAAVKSTNVTVELP